jgi:phytoene dehydrogenase-like protein
MADYDVVVVGAGNGGMTASAALAQKGLKVLLLERHNIPGGCGTSFCRGRFEFEVALHQLSGMGTPQNPGPLRTMLQSIGVLDDLEFVEIPELFRVVMPGRIDVRLQTDRSQVVDELQRHFPNEKEAIEKFFDLAYLFANQLLSVFYFNDPDASRAKYPVLYEYAFKNCEEVLDSFFSDPLLKAVLSVYWGYLGLPPNRLAFAYLAILYFSFIEFKAFHVKGGSQALSNAIVSKFLSYGGEVRFNCGVKKIEVAKGRVKGVVTEHGEKIAARSVLSNASPLATYLQLIDPEHVPDQVHMEMRGRSLSPSGFVLYMGLDCEPGELGIHDSTSFIMSNTETGDRLYDQMRQIEVDDDLMVLSCYNIADPDFSPKGTSQVSLVTLKFGEPWLRLPPTDYFRQKYRCADAMMRTLEKVYPGIRDRIEELEVGTPLTHMRYLGHPAGSIYGFEQQMKDSLFFQPGGLSPIQGLFFASGWTGDCGFQPTLEAGKAAAKSILKELGA